MDLYHLSDEEIKSTCKKFRVIICWCDSFCSRVCAKFLLETLHVIITLKPNIPSKLRKIINKH